MQTFLYTSAYGVFHKYDRKCYYRQSEHVGSETYTNTYSMSRVWLPWLL